jgi:1,2-diacylglycerol 3-alpha-glucosyltransferase
MTPSIIRLRSVPFFKWSEFRLALPIFVKSYQKVKRLNLDLIHTHTEFSIGLFGKYFARMNHIPKLHTYHTMYEDYSHYLASSKRGKKVARRFIIFQSKRYVNKFNAVIAPSSKTKEALESYGVKNNIFVVPTGVDINQFARFDTLDPKLVAIRKKFNFQPDTPLILSLGRVSEEKSIDLILEQMPNLLITIPDARLLIVGDGPHKKTLESQVKTLNLSHAVHFTGSVPWDEVPVYYSLARVFVSASKTETQGLTILEAMAARVPVIVYDDTNVKDLIIDNYSGRLFTTPDELTMCLQDILNFPTQNDQLVENAYRLVQSLSREQFGENAERIYDSLIES